MIALGIFSEMGTHDSVGSIKDFLCDNVDYDKTKVLKYLRSFKHFAGCPRAAIDCVTGEEISPSFLCYDDGVYFWDSYLPYHIEKYNIRLPEGFLKRVDEAMKSK